MGLRALSYRRPGPVRTHPVSDRPAPGGTMRSVATSSRILRRLAGATTAAALAAALSGCTPAGGSSGGSGTTSASSPSGRQAGRPHAQKAPGRHHPKAPAATGGASTGTHTAYAALERLPVKGRAPMTGYDRDRFGPAWLDADRNGCDTRNDVLGSFLTRVVHEPGTHDCVVASGTLADPYTATTIHFVRGDGTLVDIDHVVALGNAWATGAFRWPIRKRAAIANDPLNLLPVDASANRQKGDGDAATWLPPDKGYRCDYVARQVTVKAKYDLWVTPPEKAAMERVLAACPDEPVLRDSGAPVLVPVDVTDPAPEPGPGAPTGPGPSTGSVHYENCDAARAAGAAPLRRGDPGYDAHARRRRRRHRLRVATRLSSVWRATKTAPMLSGQSGPHRLAA